VTKENKRKIKLLSTHNLTSTHFSLLLARPVLSLSLVHSVFIRHEVSLEAKFFYGRNEVAGSYEHHADINIWPKIRRQKLCAVFVFISAKSFVSTDWWRSKQQVEFTGNLRRKSRRKTRVRCAKGFNLIIQRFSFPPSSLRSRGRRKTLIFFESLTCRGSKT
jgi:hypothetical protein